jgi:hypothetical protein
MVAKKKKSMKVRYGGKGGMFIGDRAGYCGKRQESGL